ncbi:Salicylyl-CoA 5-hydroxylase OS=Kitasatospora aureofaciens OX=1894 GN=GCM10010502_41210 PE=4 SV=1 [Kitasatospora aureofaciens]
MAAYEAERRPVVESTQRAAQASLEWFETVGRRTGLGVDQFAFNLLTRSRRVTYGGLRARDPEFTAAVETAVGGSSGAPPMFRPLKLGALELRNRIVVPPLATFTSPDALPSAFDRAQLTAHALGGAGLVIAGMTAVSPEGRATDRCPGLWTDGQEAAWTDLLDSVRAVSDTPVGIQLTHAGRRGATAAPGPDGIGHPLAEGWPLLAPSPLPWAPVARPRTRPTKSNWPPWPPTSPPPRSAPPGPVSTCWSCSSATGTCSPPSSPR